MMGEDAPGIFPGHIPDEVLAQRAIAGCLQLASVLPEIRELRNRFRRLSSTHTIAGCATWYQFCRERLDRTPSAIRKALAAEKLPAAPKDSKPLDVVWKQVNALCPYNGDGTEHKFIENMAQVLRSDVQPNIEHLKVLVTTLRTVIANFTVYADQLEDRIRAAGVV